MSCHDTVKGLITLLPILDQSQEPATGETSIAITVHAVDFAHIGLIAYEPAPVLLHELTVRGFLAIPSLDIGSKMLLNSLAHQNLRPGRLSWVGESRVNCWPEGCGLEGWIWQNWVGREVHERRALEYGL